MTQAVLGSLASHHLVVFPMPGKLTDRLDSIQRKFFWNKKQNVKGFSPKGWDTVAMPKVLGGLNIKKNADMNNALLVRLAWRMLCESDSLCTKLLKHNYFPLGNPLHTANENDSWVWKGIYAGLEIIKEHYCWEVGDGRRISIWNDRWIPGRNKLVSSIGSCMALNTVDQLIIHENRTWNVDLLNVLFDNETVRDICKIKIPIKGEDILRWTPSRNGLFSVKTAYRVINTVGHNPNYVAEQLQFPWIRFWRASLPPKFYFSCGKCVHDYLPVRERLARHTTNISYACPLCNIDAETVDHLLLKYQVSKQIWSAVDPNLAGIIGGLTLKNWIASWFTNTNVQECMIITAGYTLWNIWKARCSLVFENVQVQVSGV